MAYPTFRQVAMLLGGVKSVRAMATAEGLGAQPLVSLRYLLSYRPQTVKPTFRQLSTLLGGTNSMRAMAAAEGVAPGSHLSVRSLLSYRPPVISIPALPESLPLRYQIDPGYLHGSPVFLDEKAGPAEPDPFASPSMNDNGDVLSTDGRLSPTLRAIAQLRDGNLILRRVADVTAAGTEEQALLTAMTQLAATGGQAYAAWLSKPTLDLTSYLIQKGLSAAKAAAANQRIMSDFDDAVHAVRRNAGTMRQSVKGWIAVSGEDDPPDFPVNVPATSPQYHFEVSVPTPQGTAPAQKVKIRYTLVSQAAVNAQPDKPSIPPGHEVVLFIHGEGSKAEEADDFTKRLFDLAAPTARSFTVVAFDQPGCGYSTMVSHLDVAPMPPTQSPPGLEKVRGYFPLCRFSNSGFR